jgi:hypothetical protein
VLELAVVVVVVAAAAEMVLLQGHLELLLVLVEVL